MPTSLAHPLAQALPAHPPGALAADGTSHGTLHEVQADTGYGTVHGRAAYVAPVDPEGGSDRQAGGFAKQGPIPSSPALTQQPTQTVSPTHTVYFALPLVPGLNAREHPMRRSSRVKRERLATSWALQAAHVPHDLAPCLVALTRHAKNRLDSDNLQGAFKAVRDAVAQWLQTDDRSEAIEWAYRDRYEGGAACVRIEFLPKHA